ncbi:TPA: hypothetical protein ACQMLW_000765, partial [Streptococcus pyogenes]
ISIKKSNKTNINIGKTKINKIENVLNKTFTINRDKGLVIYDRLRVAVKGIYEMKNKHKKY